MALLIKPDGSLSTFPPDNGKYFQLSEIAAHIGGYLEAVRLDAGVVMYVNEEGMLEGLPLNATATDYAIRHGSLIKYSGCAIRGTAIVVPPYEGQQDEEEEEL